MRARALSIFVNKHVKKGWDKGGILPEAPPPHTPGGMDASWRRTLGGCDAAEEFDRGKEGEGVTSDPSSL